MGGLSCRPLVITRSGGDRRTLRDARRTAGRPGWGGWGSDGVAAESGWRDHLLAIADDAVDERTHGRRERLRDHSDGDACFRWALGLLDSVASDDVPRSVVHCDLINRNVHVVGDTITGIFDWGCGR